MQEFTKVVHSEPRRAVIDGLWESVKNVLPSSIQAYRDVRKLDQSFGLMISSTFTSSEWLESGSQSGPGDDGATFESTHDHGFRLEIQAAENSDGLWWNTKVSQRRSDLGDTVVWTPRQSIRFVGINFANDWNATLDSATAPAFKDVLRRESNCKHLVIVAMPWWPNVRELPSEVLQELSIREQRLDTTCLLSPAAFCTMLSCIVRDFASGKEFAELLTNRQHASSLANVGIQETVDSLRGKFLPPTTREQLLQYFEVR
jgi:hypothetical protein